MRALRVSFYLVSWGTRALLPPPRDTFLWWRTRECSLSSEKCTLTTEDARWGNSGRLAKSLLSLSLGDGRGEAPVPVAGNLTASGMGEAALLGRRCPAFREAQPARTLQGSTRSLFLRLVKTSWPDSPVQVQAPPGFLSHGPGAALGKLEPLWAPGLRRLEKEEGGEVGCCGTEAGDWGRDAVRHSPTVTGKVGEWGLAGGARSRCASGSPAPPTACGRRLVRGTLDWVGGELPALVGIQGKPGRGLGPVRDPDSCAEKPSFLDSDRSPSLWVERFNYTLLLTLPPPTRQ